VGTAVKVRHRHEQHDGDGWMVEVAPGGWAGPVVGMTRRRGVGRLPPD
jgi:hypothetical protein